jgi:hypothetical protein
MDAPCQCLFSQKMALNQKQLFTASQLFISFGKVGVAFDLSRFVGDEAFRFETLERLMMRATSPALQTLVAEASMTFTPATQQPPSSSSAASPATAPAPSAISPEKTETRYVGRLR